MSQKDKGFALIPFLILFSLVILVGITFKNKFQPASRNDEISEVYDPFTDRTPSIDCSKSSDPNTETCTVKADGGEFTFVHPISLPVLTPEEGWSHRGEQHISISTYDTNITYGQLTKEQLVEVKTGLQEGTLVDRYASPFSNWSVDAEIKTLSNGSFARVSTTFGAFEVCDRQFSRRIEFVSDERIFVVSIEGDGNKIFGELPSDYLTYEFADECGGRAKSTTGSLEILANNSAAAAEWVSAYEQVLQTISF